MSDLTIRPTAKFLKAGTALAATVFLGLEIAYLALWTGAVDHWVMILPPLLMLWAAVPWVRRQTTRAVITGDRLRYERGIVSKTTRNIQLAKIQDVRVQQGLLERILNVGEISIETAGEASRFTLFKVDGPQALADEIMNRAQSGTAKL